MPDPTPQELSERLSGFFGAPVRFQGYRFVHVTPDSRYYALCEIRKTELETNRDPEAFRALLRERAEQMKLDLEAHRNHA